MSVYHCLKAYRYGVMMNRGESQITQLLAAHRLLKNNVTYSSYHIKMFSVIKRE
jgi:hypothetical protein